MLPTPLSDDEMISMLSINEPPGWRSVPLAIRHTARGDYITDTTIPTRLRLVLVDRKLLGKNIPKEIGILIDDGHQRKHPAIPKGQEKRTQPQILYGYARDHETQAVVVLFPGPELYQMHMWEVLRAKPFAYADTNNPFDPLPGSYFFDAAAIIPQFEHPPPGRYEGHELKNSIYKGKRQIDYERMMRKAAKEEHHYMEDDEKDFESKDLLQYGNLAQELIDLLCHHARVCGKYKENSPLSEVNVNGYLTHIYRMREDWPYVKWTFYVENVMKAYNGPLRCRYMETWAKQRFPVDRPNFPQDEEGKILTVQACYFLAYHIVDALSPAKEMVMDIEPRLQFVFLPHYWFKNLWLEIGLAVAGGKEYSEKRPPTGLVKAALAPQQKDGVLVTQNDVERIEVFLPIWMVPPIYNHHNDLKVSSPSGSQERFNITLDKMQRPYRLERPAMHIQSNLRMPIENVNFPLLKEAALRGVLGHATWHCRKKDVKVKSQIFLPAGEAFRHSLGRLTRDAFPQYWPLTTSQALAHLDMYKTVTMASMKEIFTQLPHNDESIHGLCILLLQANCRSKEGFQGKMECSWSPELVTWPRWDELSWKGHWSACHYCKTSRSFENPWRRSAVGRKSSWRFPWWGERREAGNGGKRICSSSKPG